MSEPPWTPSPLGWRSYTEPELQAIIRGALIRAGGEERVRLRLSCALVDWRLLLILPGGGAQLEIRYLKRGRLCAEVLDL